MQRVLIIDDETLVRETLRDALESEGYTVFEASDGMQGVEIFDSLSSDAAIVDMLMPDKEGIETIVELRKRNPSLKIVAMSGGGATNQMEFLEIARKVGADRTLRKPIDIALLLETMDALFDRHVTSKAVS
jgi:DNA-binding response OmpR family regulator